MNRILIPTTLLLVVALTLLYALYTRDKGRLEEANDLIQRLRMENSLLYESFEKYRLEKELELSLIQIVQKREEYTEEQRKEIKDSVQERYEQSVENVDRDSSDYLAIDYSDILYISHERQAD